MLNDECGWKDGDRSVRIFEEPNTRLETNRHDGPFNWLGRQILLLTSTGLLMEGAIHFLIG